MREHWGFGDARLEVGGGGARDERAGEDRESFESKGEVLALDTGGGRGGLQTEIVHWNAKDWTSGCTPRRCCYTVLSP